MNDAGRPTVPNVGPGFDGAAPHRCRGCGTVLVVSGKFLRANSGPVLHACWAAEMLELAGTGSPFGPSYTVSIMDPV